MAKIKVQKSRSKKNGKKRGRRKGKNEEWHEILFQILAERKENISEKSAILLPGKNSFMICGIRNTPWRNVPNLCIVVNLPSIESAKGCFGR